MNITITNDFHDTSTSVRSRHLSPRVVRRVRRALCGMDCHCGGDLSERGRDAVVGADGTRFDVVRLFHGGPVHLEVPERDYTRVEGTYEPKENA